MLNPTSLNVLSESPSRARFHQPAQSGRANFLNSDRKPTDNACNRASPKMQRRKRQERKEELYRMSSFQRLRSTKLNAVNQKDWPIVNRFRFRNSPLYFSGKPQFLCPQKLEVLLFSFLINRDDQSYSSPFGK